MPYHRYYIAYGLRLVSAFSVYTPEVNLPLITARLQYHLIQKLPESKAFHDEIALCLHTDYSIFESSNSSSKVFN